MNKMTALWLLLLLMSFNTHRLGASKSLCNSKPFQNFPFSEENLCIDMDTVPSFNLSGYYRPKAEEIKMTLIEEDEALEVRFPLANSRDYDRYHLLLKVMEPRDGKCPENANFYSSMKIHSRHIFDVFKCSDLKGLSMEDCSPVCNRTGVVVFKYIFTGCYQVSVTPALDKRPFAAVKSQGLRFFKTNHTMRRIAEMVPVVEPQCSESGYDSEGRQQNRVESFFARKEEWGDIPVTMELMENVNLNLGVQACSRSGIRHSCCTYNPLTKGEFNCRNKNLTGPTYCEKTESFFKCTFENISVGNHCVTFEPYDTTRCRQDTVWLSPGRGCFFTRSFSCKKSPTKLPHKEETPSTLDPILISVAAVVAVCCIAGISYFIFQRHKQGNRIGGSDLDLVPTPMHKSHPHVLLLYAQDCKEFMKLMETFRSVLSNVCECEVLDCFDADREGEIADNPVAWMRRNASSPEVKVVVVASECAMRHQVALENRTELSYLDPLPRSHLFRYGLQEVTNNHRRQYANTFVVRFDGTDLKYITKFTRFKLPLMLKELLSNINPGLDLSHMEEFRDVQRLQENCEELIRYKEEHPEYFTKLIVKLEDPVIV